MTRTSVHDLILPALLIIAFSEDRTARTFDFAMALRDIVEPTNGDLEILLGRGDDKFSQTVRNLKCTNILERLGYAEYNEGIFTITKEGLAYLRQNISSFVGRR